MTDITNDTSRKATHIAYQVRKGSKETFWDRIGVAWINQDGKGFNLQLNAVPLDGRITVRIIEPK